MNRQISPFGPVFALSLVALSGFIGGAIILLALKEAANPLDPTALIAGGLAGSTFYLAGWLALSYIISHSKGASLFETARKLSIWFAVSLSPVFSYFPYLVYRNNISGESVELPPLGSRASVLALLCWSLLLLALLVRITAGKRDSALLDRLTHRPYITLFSMMAFALAVFFAMDILKVHYMQVTSVNSALFREAMLDPLDERGFMYSDLLFANGASLFAVHLNVIFLLILPVFMLFPDYRFLMLISDAALVLAAWPVYLIARRHFSTATSLMLAAMFLLHPILTAQPGRSDFSELRFAPVIFLTSFYLFEQKRFRSFIAMILLFITIREDMGLIVLMLGIYALFRRRSLKWVIVPVIVGAGWTILSLAVLIPAISPSGTAARVTIRYSNLGSGGKEIATNLLLRPWKAFRAMFSTPSHVGAVYGVLISFGLGIPLLSGSVIIAIPAVAELLFQQTTTFNNFMAILVIATLFVPYIYGLSRCDHIAQRRWQIESGRTAAILGLIMLFLSVSAFHTWFNVGLYKPRYNYDAALEAFSQVPEDATLLMPEFMLVYGKPEQNVRGYHQIMYQVDIEGKYDINEDYVIVDRRIPDRIGESRYYEGLISATGFVENSEDYEQVFKKNDIELYVRKQNSV